MQTHALGTHQFQKKLYYYLCISGLTYEGCSSHEKRDRDIAHIQLVPHNRYLRSDCLSLATNQNEGGVNGEFETIS